MSNQQSQLQLNKKHRFCAVIPARNEELVIGRIVDSLMAQDYPTELLDIWVAPNNCTDNTESVAKKHGAKIFNCTEPVSRKGDVLNQFFEYMLSKNDIYDCYCIFDADNIADKRFIAAMNNAYCSGTKVAQGQRDSINANDNCLTGCQALYYSFSNSFSEKDTNNNKTVLLTGTGNMLSAEVLKKIKFKSVTITEDGEYFCECCLNNVCVKYAKDAIFFEEHPTSLEIAWTQLRRWYSGLAICSRIYKKRFSEAIIKKQGEYCTSALPIIQIAFSALKHFLGGFILLIVIVLGLKHIGINITTTLILIGVAIITIYIGFTFKLIKYSKRRDVPRCSFIMFGLYMNMHALCAAISSIAPIKKWKPIKRSSKDSFNQ